MLLQVIVGHSALRASILERVQRDRVELQPVIHELVAERLGDGRLERLDLLVLELHHLARREVDQVMVVLVGVPPARLRIRPPQAPVQRRDGVRPPPGRPARPPAAPLPLRVARPRPGSVRRPLGRCADRRCQCKDRGPPRLPGPGSGRDDPTDPGRTPASCVRSARSAPDRLTGPDRPDPICAKRASSCARSQAASSGSPRNAPR